MHSSDNRIPGLDGLRAISILIVVVSHLSFSRLKADKFFLTGNLGVRIFFIISGFLIAGILIREFEKKSRIDLKKFYFRRTFRIFPAYLFFLGLMLLFAVAGLLSFRDFLPPLTYSTNYLIGETPIELNHSWSLAVEEQFYLIFPVVLSLIGLTHLKKFLFAILLLTPLIRVAAFFGYSSFGEPEFLAIAWNFHTNMDILATGCLLALCRNELHADKYYRRLLDSSLTPCVLLPLIFAAGYFADNYLVFFYLIGLTVMNFAIMVCIDWLIVNQTSAASRFLNLAPLRFIGVLSYSIYLWQQPFAFYSETMPWTYLPGNLFLLAVFSLLTYYLVEKRFLALRRKLEDRWFGKPDDILPARLGYENGH